jgi:hypothetical protein
VEGSISTEDKADPLAVRHGLGVQRNMDSRRVVMLLKIRNEHQHLTNIVLLTLKGGART